MSMNQHDHSSHPIENDRNILNDSNQSRILAGRDFVNEEFGLLVSSEVAMAKNEMTNLFQSFFSEYKSNLAIARAYSEELEKKVKANSEALKKAEETIFELRTKVFEDQALFQQFLSSKEQSELSRTRVIEQVHDEMIQVVQRLFQLSWEEFLKRNSLERAGEIQEMKALFNGIEKGIDQSLRNTFKELNEKIKSFDDFFKEILPKKEEMISGLQNDLSKKLQLEENWFAASFHEIKEELATKLSHEKDSEWFETTCMDKYNEEIFKEIIQIEKKAIALENDVEKVETESRTSLASFESFLGQITQEGDLVEFLRRREKEINENWEFLTRRLEENKRMEKDLQEQMETVNGEVKKVKGEIEETGKGKGKEGKSHGKIQGKIEELEQLSKKNEKALVIVSQKAGTEYEAILLKIKEFEESFKSRIKELRELSEDIAIQESQRRESLLESAIKGQLNQIGDGEHGSRKGNYENFWGCMGTNGDFRNGLGGNEYNEGGNESNGVPRAGKVIEPVHKEFKGSVRKSGRKRLFDPENHVHQPVSVNEFSPNKIEGAPVFLERKELQNQKETSRINEGISKKGEIRQSEIISNGLSSSGKRPNVENKHEFEQRNWRDIFNGPKKQEETITKPLLGPKGAPVLFNQQENRKESIGILGAFDKAKEAPIQAQNSGERSITNQVNEIFARSSFRKEIKRENALEVDQKLNWSVQEDRRSSLNYDLENKGKIGHLGGGKTGRNDFEEKRGSLLELKKEKTLIDEKPSKLVAEIFKKANGFGKREELGLRPEDFMDVNDESQFPNLSESSVGKPQAEEISDSDEENESSIQEEKRVNEVLNSGSKGLGSSGWSSSGEETLKRIGVYGEKGDFASKIVDGLFKKHTVVEAASSFSRKSHF